MQKKPLENPQKLRLRLNHTRKERSLSCLSLVSRNMSDESSSLGGWSLYDFHFGSSESISDPDEKVLSPSPGPESGVSVEHEQSSRTNEVVADNEVLRKLLATLCDIPPRVNTITQTPENTFGNLVEFITQHPPVAEWASSTRNGSLLLRLPATLIHSSLLQGLLLKFDDISPCAKNCSITVKDNYRGQSGVIHILAQLCLALLEGSDPRSELEDDLALAVQAHEDKRLENILWNLAASLIIESRSVLIALGFTATTNSGQVQLLGKIGHLIKNTDASVKLVAVVYGDAQFESTSDLEYQVPQESKSLHDALCKDYESRVAAMVTERSRLKGIIDQLNSLGKSFLTKPVLFLSYLDRLRHQVQITSHRLEKDSKRLSSAGCWLDTVLNEVPEKDQQYAGRILASIKHCGRPLDRTELATISQASNEGDYTMGTIPQRSQEKSETGNYPETGKNNILDIEYDLSRLLPGIVETQEDGGLLFSSPSIGHYLDGEDTCKEHAWLVPEPGSHTYLARRCLNYLASWAANDPTELMSDDLEQELAKWPLLEYSATYWHYHYEESAKKGFDSTYVDPFLDDTNLLWAAATLWLHLNFGRPRRLNPKDLEDIKPGFISSRFGVGMPIAIRTFFVAAQLVSLSQCSTEAAVVCALARKEVQSSALDHILSNLELSDPYLENLPFTRLKGLLESERTHGLLNEKFSYIAAKALQHGAFDIFADFVRLSSPNGAVLMTLPWKYVVWYGNIAVIERIVEAGYMPKDTLAIIQPAILLEAVKVDDVQSVIQLLRLCTPSPEVLGETLIASTERGLVSIIRELCRYIPDRGAIPRDAKGQNPLHIASDHGFKELTQIFLEFATFITEQDFQGDTPLHLAVVENRPEIVQIILKHCRTHGIPTVDEPHDSPNGDEIQGLVTVHHGDEGAAERAVKEILEMKNLSGHNAVQEAAIRGERTIMEILLASLDPSSIDEHGLLHLSARYMNAGVMEYLLGFQNVDINQRDYRDRTPLHIATMEGNIDLVRMLLERGATTDTTDYWGDSPFDDALMSENEDLILLLLKNSPADKESMGRQLYKLSTSRYRYLQAIELLLDSGADTNWENDDQRTPLHAASYTGKEEIVKLLLMRRAELEKVDRSGDTPLSDAVLAGHINIVRLLLGAGAEFEWKNESVVWPLRRATTNDYVEMMELFLQKGASLSFGYAESDHLLEVAIENDSKKNFGTHSPWKED